MGRVHNLIGVNLYQIEVLLQIVIFQIFFHDFKDDSTFALILESLIDQFCQFLYVILITWSEVI